jgi:hypothetical protein
MDLLNRIVSECCLLSDVLHWFSQDDGCYGCFGFNQLPRFFHAVKPATLAILVTAAEWALAVVGLRHLKIGIRIQIPLVAGIQKPA